jgi:hypothetical protein
MKHPVIILLAFGFTTGVSFATETLDPRYKVLIDRPPFGQVKGAEAVDVAPNWVANYVFSAIVQSNSGNGAVQAIIATKDNSHWYFRSEGESIDGTITVLKIDLSQKAPKLVLRNGLETGTLTYPERTAVAAPPPTPMAIPGAPGAAPAGAPPTVRRIPFRRAN